MKSIKNTINLMVNSDIVSAFVMAYCFFAVYCPPFAKLVFQPSILQSMRILGFVMIFIFYFAKVIIRKRISFLVLSSSMFALYILFMSYLNHSADSVIYLYQVINLICAVLINDIFSSDNKKYLFYIVVLFVLSSYLLADIILYIINFITTNHGYQYYIYSNRNVMFVYLIPIFLLYNFFINSKYRHYYVIVVSISILYNIIHQAFTSSIVFIVFIIYNYYLNKNKNIYNFQTSFTLMLIIVSFIFFSLVYFGTSSIFVIIAEKISNVIPKLQSLYDRAEIYDVVRDYCLIHPFFGYGYKYYYDGVEVYRRNFVLTHNTIFDILIYGGIFAIIGFFINQYIVVDNCKYDKKYQAYIIFSLLCITLRDMFESTSLYFIFFNYGLLYYFI